MSNFDLKRATLNNLQWIHQQIEACKPLLAQHQFGQWQGKEPSQETLKKDILTHQYFLLTNQHQSLGGVAILPDDPAYHHLLKGQWINDHPFFVLHRLFIAPAFHHQGFGKQLLKAVEDYALSQRVFNVRLDTHERNIPMRQLLLSMKYVHCGEVFLPNAGLRFVYHKVIR